MRRTQLIAPAVALLAFVAGCSAAEDVASSAGDAAADAARQEALDQLRAAVCPVVEDDQISDEDRRNLQAAVDLAQAAGVESEFLTQVEDVLGTDGTPPESAVAELAEECAA